MSIRKRGHAFQVRLHIGGISSCKTFPTKQEARQWEALQRLTLLAAGCVYEKSQHMTIGCLLAEYATHGLHDKRGARQELSRIECLRATPWARAPLLELVPADVDELMRTLKEVGLPGRKPLKDDTRRLYFASIAAAFKYAIQGLGWHFLADPTRAAKKPAPGQPRTRVLGPREEERLVEGFRQASSPYYGFAFLLLIATTMRMGELFAVTWQDVDWKQRVIVLPRDKGHGSAGRRVPLSPETLALLEYLPRMAGEVRLLPVERSAFESFWKRLLERLEIQNLRLHDLRREGITRWALKLKNVVLLQQVSGHKTLAMVQRYINLDLDDVLQAMDAACVDDPLLKNHVRPAKAQPGCLVRHLLP
jgi:integrase